MAAKIGFCQIYVTEINDYKRKVNCLIQVKQNYNMPYSLIVTPVSIYIQLTYFTIIKSERVKNKDMTSRYLDVMISSH